MPIRKKIEAGLQSDMLLSQLARVLTKVELFLNQESFSSLEPALPQQRDTPKAFQTGHTLNFFPAVLIVTESKNNLRNVRAERFFLQSNLLSGVVPQVKVCGRIKFSCLNFIVHVSIYQSTHTHKHIHVCIIKFQYLIFLYMQANYSSISPVLLTHSAERKPHVPRISMRQVQGWEG